LFSFPSQNREKTALLTRHTLSNGIRLKLLKTIKVGTRYPSLFCALRSAEFSGASGPHFLATSPHAKIKAPYLQSLKSIHDNYKLHLDLSVIGWKRHEN